MGHKGKRDHKPVSAWNIQHLWSGLGLNIVASQNNSVSVLVSTPCKIPPAKQGFTKTQSQFYRYDLCKNPKWFLGRAGSVSPALIPVVLPFPSPTGPAASH